MNVEEYRAHWFGRPWPSDAVRAGICEDEEYHVPTPVGMRCQKCREGFSPNTRGIFTLFVGLEATAMMPIHLDCWLASIFRLQEAAARRSPTPRRAWVATMRETADILSPDAMRVEFDD